MPPTKPLNVNDIKISKIQIKGEGKLLAIVQLEYLGVLMRGFRIMRSEELDRDISAYIWIQPPCAKAYGQWIKLIRFLDDEVWRQLKAKVHADYQIAADDYYRQKFNEPRPTENTASKAPDHEEVETDIEDIPF